MIGITLLAQVLLYPGLSGLVRALGASSELDPGMWFLAAEFAAFIAFAPLWGALSDRLGVRTPLIATSALLSAGCYLGLGALGIVGVADFRSVLVVRILQGACTIGAFSLAMTMLMDLSGGHGRNMGAAGIAIGSGTALGAPLGGAVSTLGPLAPLFVAGGLFFGIASVLTFVRDRAPRSDRPGIRAALRDVLGHPDLAVPYAFGFVDRLTAGTFALVGVFYFGEFGLEPVGVGIFLMLFFAPFALLQYPFGFVTDRVGRFLPVVGGSICYGIGIALVGQMPTLPTVGVVMIAVGVFGALVSPATMAMVTDIAPEMRRGSAMAGFNVAGSLGFLAGVLLGGTLADAYGYAVAFAAIGGLEIGIAILATPWFRRFEDTIPITGT